MTNLTPGQQAQVEKVEKDMMGQLSAMLSISDQRRAKKVAKAILSRPDILIKDADQSLPKPTSLPFKLDPSELMVSKAGIGIQQTQLMVYTKAQQDMRAANFVKVIKELGNGD